MVDVSKFVTNLDNFYTANTVGVIPKLDKEIRIAQRLDLGVVRVSIENAAIFFLLFAIAKTPRQRAIAETFVLGRVTISRVIIIIVLGSITFNEVIIALASFAIIKTRIQ